MGIVYYILSKFSDFFSGNKSISDEMMEDYYLDQNYVMNDEKWFYGVSDIV